MDRKSIIILILCFIAFFSWHWIVDKIYPPKPIPVDTNTTAIGTSPTNTNAPRVAGAESAETSPAPRQARSQPTAPEEFLEVTNAISHYTFSSHGGGLKQVELLQYPETVSTLRRRKTETNRVATLNSFTPQPTLAIVDGPELEGDGVFQLSRTATGVRAQKQLTNGLSIIKEFEPTSNYLVLASIRLENRSDKP